MVFVQYMVYGRVFITVNQREEVYIHISAGSWPSVKFLSSQLSEVTHVQYALNF